jgi:hypothetical protein
MPGQAVVRSRPRPYKVRRGFLVRLSLLMPLFLAASVSIAGNYQLRCFRTGYFGGSVYLRDTPLQPGFDGPEAQLLQTQYVASLETLVKRHRNVLWISPDVDGQALHVAFSKWWPRDVGPGLAFRGSLGGPVRTSYFGKSAGSGDVFKVLSGTQAGCCGMEPGDLVIDPGPDSYPYQVILAEVELQATLAQTVDYVGFITRKFAASEAGRYPYRGFWVELAIPSVFFRIWRGPSDSARPFELEINAVSATNQDEDVRYSGLELLCIPGAVIFKRPFLLILRERQSGKQVVVLWVDNAELISRRPDWWPGILRSFG